MKVYKLLFRKGKYAIYDYDLDQWVEVTKDELLKFIEAVTTVLEVVMKNGN